MVAAAGEVLLFLVSSLDQCRRLTVGDGLMPVFPGSCLDADCNVGGRSFARNEHLGCYFGPLPKPKSALWQPISARVCRMDSLARSRNLIWEVKALSNASRLGSVF